MKRSRASSKTAYVSLDNAHGGQSMRIDKWLWAARFYKTRAIAADEIGKGRVLLNGMSCKPARDVRCGNTVAVRQGYILRTVVVLALSDKRGSAQMAQTLYAETPESVEQRQKLAAQQRLAPEPAGSLTQGRPTKRDRRQMQKAQQHTRQEADDWGGRWSARWDED